MARIPQQQLDLFIATASDVSPKSHQDLMARNWFSLTKKKRTEPIFHQFNDNWVKVSGNDKYGMAYSMEGRFPLATKTFMQHCMNIHSDQKIGKEKGDTKLLTKIAYKDLLPNVIINKMKTGWTVPLQHWWNKSGKANIPAMILEDWKKTYRVKT